MKKFVLATVLAVIVVFGGIYALTRGPKISQEQMTEALAAAAHEIMSDSYTETLASAARLRDLLNMGLDEVNPAKLVLSHLQHISSEEELVDEVTVALNAKWGEDWTYILKQNDIDEANLAEFMQDRLLDYILETEYEVWLAKKARDTELLEKARQDLAGTKERRAWLESHDDDLRAALGDELTDALYQIDTYAWADEETVTAICEALPDMEPELADTIMELLNGRGLIKAHDDDTADAASVPQSTPSDTEVIPPQYAPVVQPPLARAGDFAR